MERILIIEDDDVLAQGVKFNLELAGFSFAGSLRKEREIPVIFLTARDLDEDMMRGFEIGADDYITKPFNVLILVQRVRAVLKRYHAGSRKRERVKTGNLEIDFQSWQVWKSGVELTLTPTEFRLLKKFCDNPGIVLTRRVLLETMWDKEEKFVDEHTLTMFVSRLRSKISDEEHSYIRTVYGTGISGWENRAEWSILWNSRSYFLQQWLSLLQFSAELRRVSGCICEKSIFLIQKRC